MSDLRNRLKANGIDESRLAMIGLGEPVPPTIDPQLVADLAASSGKTTTEVERILAAQAAAVEQSERPAMARAFAKHVEPGPYTPPKHWTEDPEKKAQVLARAEAVRQDHEARVQRIHDVRRYRETTNPFAAARFAARNPHVYDPEDGSSGPKSAA